MPQLSTQGLTSSVTVAGTVTVAGSVVASMPTPAFKMGRNLDVDLIYENLGSQALTQGCWLKNVSTGVQQITIADVSDTDGWTLLPGESSNWIPCTDISQIRVKSDIVNAIVAWHGY
jgi:hypothetical protein